MGHRARSVCLAALTVGLVAGGCSSSDPTLSGAAAGAAGSGTAGTAAGGKSSGGTAGAPMAGSGGASTAGTAGAGGSVGGGGSGAAGKAAGGTGGKAAGGSAGAAAGTAGASAGSAGTAGTAGASGTAGAAAGAAGMAGAPGCDPTLGADCCPSMTCGTTEGMVCNAGGKCECDLGATDCDGVPENGCEATPDAVDCDGQPANGCEAPLLTDGKNCGKCGHDCGGGTCVAGLCQPVMLVAATASQLNSGTWDQGSSPVFDYLYRDAAGWVGPERDPVGGKFQVRTYSPSGIPGAFITSESVDVPVRIGPLITPIGVVWTESGGLLRRVARGGGSVTTLQVAVANAIRVDATSVYLLSSEHSGGTGAVYSFTKGSLTPTTLYSVTGKNIFDLALDGSGGLYLHDGTALLEGSTAGKPITTRYAVFGSGNFWLLASADAVFGYGANMIKLDLATSNLTELLPATAAAGQEDIRHALLDGDWIYYVKIVAQKYVLHRVPKAGGTPTKLYSGPLQIWGLSQDAEYLYYWSGGYTRLRKPAP